jgi:PAS domain S-box-containing protein
MQDLSKIELLDALFINATEGIIVCDSRGIILLCNPASEKMFGYTSQEIVGERIEMLVPDEVKEKHTGYRESYATNPHARPMGLGLNLNARRKDGSLLPIEISLSPLERDGEKLVIAFLIDISKRRLIEESVKDKQIELEKVAAALIATNEELEKKVGDRTKVLREAIRELEKSRNELSSALEKEKDLNDLKSRFISMASHEFRTPLTTILSSASLISEYSKPEQVEKKDKHINRIKSAVNNLNDILSDFLSISKLEEGKVHADFKKFDLQHLIEEVLGDMQLSIKRGQKLNYVHEGEKLVFLDPKLIKNILINLISNAIKFTDENKEINISSKTEIETIFLIVEDQGIGISEEDQKHLFERFYRGKNAFNIQGTGLGLHIVGNYIDLMQGHLHLRSELNKGTNITITFPNQKEL